MSCYWVEVRFLVDPARLGVIGERVVTDMVREDKHLSACLVVDDPARASVSVGIQVSGHPNLTRATIEGQTFARQLMADLLDLDTEFVEPPSPVEVRALDGEAELNHMLQAVA